jgi:hypothetical protein
VPAILLVVAVLGEAVVFLVAYHLWPQTRRERAAKSGWRRVASVSIVIAGSLLVLLALYVVPVYNSLGVAGS